MHHDVAVNGFARQDGNEPQSSLLLSEASESKIQVRNSKKKHSVQTYIMEVASEDLLLHWSNVFAEKVEPMLFEAHLIHVNVSGGHILVGAGKSRILPERKTNR